MKKEFFKNFVFGQKITSNALIVLYEQFEHKEDLYMDKYGKNETEGAFFMTIEMQDGAIKRRASFIFTETIGGINIMECIYIK